MGQFINSKNDNPLNALERESPWNLQKVCPLGPGLYVSYLKYHSSVMVGVYQYYY